MENWTYSEFIRTKTLFLKIINNIVMKNLTLSDNFCLYSLKSKGLTRIKSL